MISPRRQAIAGCTRSRSNRREVFDDPFIIEWIDEGQDEHERFSALGMVENRLLYVAYTMRGSAIRIISARRAEAYERRRYHEENQT
jgi:hypothetical protein